MGRVDLSRNRTLWFDFHVVPLWVFLTDHPGLFYLNRFSIVFLGKDSPSTRTMSRLVPGHAPCMLRTLAYARACSNPTSNAGILALSDSRTGALRTDLSPAGLSRPEIPNGIF